MSRSATDPLYPGPRGFAHRGLHGPDPFVENGLLAFVAALEHGAGIECDLRLTADGRILVFHDADARRLCHSPAEIGRRRADELALLRVGGHPIPTLERLLALVDGQVPLLLEVKVDGNRWRWARALADALDDYRGRFGVMSFDPGLVRLVQRDRPRWRRGLVVADRLPGWRRWIALHIADPHFLAVETAAIARPWVAQQRALRPIYSWTVRSREQRRALHPRVDALIWEGDGRP